MPGRTAMRQGVAAFLAPPAVAGLNRVWSGEPRLVTTQDYTAGQQAKVISGAVGFPFIEAQDERREAFGGITPAGVPQGWKLVHYEVAFAVRFLSYQAVGSDALDDHDAIVDALVARLRSDRTMGGAAWEAGEGDTVNGTDIHVVSGPGPRQRKSDGPIVIWSMVRWVALEWVNT